MQHERIGVAPEFGDNERDARGHQAGCDIARQAVERGYYLGRNTSLHGLEQGLRRAAGNPAYRNHFVLPVGARLAGC